jgi:hypothetical protein
MTLRVALLIEGWRAGQDRAIWEIRMKEAAN